MQVAFESQSTDTCFSQNFGRGMQKILLKCEKKNTIGPKISKSHSLETLLWTSRITETIQASNFQNSQVAFYPSKRPSQVVFLPRFREDWIVMDDRSGLGRLGRPTCYRIRGRKHWVILYAENVD